MNILKEIAEKTKERVAKEKQEKTLEEIKQEAFAINTDTGFPFEKALKEEKLSLTKAKFKERMHTNSVHNIYAI